MIPQESITMGKVSSSSSGFVTCRPGSPAGSSVENENDFLPDDNPLKKSLAGIMEKLRKTISNTSAKKTIEEPMVVDQQPVASTSSKATPTASTDDKHFVEISQQFQQILDLYGGPLNLFKKTAADLEIKFRFGTSLKLNDETKSSCVFLMMKFPVNLKQMFREKETHAVNGVGDDAEKAKQKAAYEALKFLKLMIFNDSPSAFA